MSGTGLASAHMPDPVALPFRRGTRTGETRARISGPTLELLFGPFWSRAERDSNLHGSIQSNGLDEVFSARGQQ